MRLASMLISYTAPLPWFIWVDTAGGMTTMSPFTGYRVKGEAISVLTLPDSSNSPDGCRLVVDGYSGGWEIRCGEGQKIVFGSKESSTSGNGGVRSTHPTNLAELAYIGQGLWKIFCAVGILSLF